MGRIQSFARAAQILLAAGAIALGSSSAQAAAAGNVRDGLVVFMEQCAVCHTNNKGGANKIGPNLFGVVGRKSASLTNFMYSPAMNHANLTWNPETLAVYLQKPQKVVPGTKMGFPGFANPQDEADLITFLATLK